MFGTESNVTLSVTCGSPYPSHSAGRGAGRIGMIISRMWPLSTAGGTMKNSSGYAVKLIGRAQAAYKRLSEETRVSYGESVKALQQRFEPESKRELYTVQFQVRHKNNRRRMGRLW